MTKDVPTIPASIQEKCDAFVCDCGRSGRELTFEARRTEPAGRRLALAAGLKLDVWRFRCPCGRPAVAAEELVEGANDDTPPLVEA